MDTFSLAPEHYFPRAEGAGQNTQLYNSISESVWSAQQPKLGVLQSTSIPLALTKIQNSLPQWGIPLDTTSSRHLRGSGHRMVQGYEMDLPLSK